MRATACGRAATGQISSVLKAAGITAAWEAASTTHCGARGSRAARSAWWAASFLRFFAFFPFSRIGTPMLIRMTQSQVAPGKSCRVWTFSTTGLHMTMNNHIIWPYSYCSVFLLFQGDQRIQRPYGRIHIHYTHTHKYSIQVKGLFRLDSGCAGARGAAVAAERRSVAAARRRAVVAARLGAGRRRAPAKRVQRSEWTLTEVENIEK
jgi:hypothetical protein